MMENRDPVRLARVVAGAAVLAGLAVSVAVRVCSPMVLNVTATVTLPPSVPVNVWFAGSNAAASELVKAIVPA